MLHRAAALDHVWSVDPGLSMMTGLACTASMGRWSQHLHLPNRSTMRKAPRVLIKVESKGRAYRQPDSGAWALSQVRWAHTRASPHAYTIHGCMRTCAHGGSGMGGTWGAWQASHG